MENIGHAKCICSSTGFRIKQKRHASISHGTMHYITVIYPLIIHRTSSNTQHKSNSYSSVESDVNIWREMPKDMSTGLLCSNDYVRHANSVRNHPHETHNIHAHFLGNPFPTYSSGLKGPSGNHHYQKQFPWQYMMLPFWLSFPTHEEKGEQQCKTIAMPWTENWKTSFITKDDGVSVRFAQFNQQNTIIIHQYPSSSFQHFFLFRVNSTLKRCSRFKHAESKSEIPLTCLAYMGYSKSMDIYCKG